MTGQMLQIQHGLAERGWLGNEVVLVTVTFDPERDTSDRLHEYADEVHADTDSWLWLTGDLIKIKQLVGGEFGVYFEKVPPRDAGEIDMVESGGQGAGYDFIHAAVFVLVDDQGMIRAEYHELMDVDQILRDIRLVVNEKNASGPERVIWQVAHLLRAYP